jgi:hypothetical protein
MTLSQYDSIITSLLIIRWGIAVIIVLLMAIFMQTAINKGDPK